MVRITGAKKGRGLTNAQAAEKYGLAPILNDGYVATLHHSQQRSVGSLFEASTRYHNISNAKKEIFKIAFFKCTIVKITRTESLF